MANSKGIIQWDGREWQKTGGKYYILRTDYKNRSGEMLHRAIWKKYKGDIPKGYVIHHKDHNPDKNSIENLECIQVSEHQRMHALERAEQSRENLEKVVRPKLYEWQQSEEGQQRLKEFGARLAEQNKQRIYKTICPECGTEYNKVKGRESGLCRKCAKRRTAKRLYEKTHIPKEHKEVICSVCGKTFIQKSNRQKYCSSECATKSRRIQYRNRRG